MLYIIADILLKVALNTNKTGHHVYVILDILLKVALNTNTIGLHVIRYNWHIVESGIKYK